MLHKAESTNQTDTALKTLEIQHHRTMTNSDFLAIDNKLMLDSHAQFMPFYKQEC